MTRSIGQRRSQAQERRTAREVGGRVQPGSGSMDHAKSDVRSMGKLRIECKTTGKKVFNLKIKDLLKIRMEALQGGLEGWAYQIQFEGNVGVHKRFAVVDRIWFNDLGGTVSAADYLEVSNQSIGISLARFMANTQPWGLHWHFVQRGINQHLDFAVCSWEEFLELYQKENA